MKIQSNIIVRHIEKPKILVEFDEAVLTSFCQYSLRNLVSFREIDEETMQAALRKSMKICELAGMNIERHFKKRFIYDAKNHSISLDWRLSQKALNLLFMQLPIQDINTAKWIWKLIEM